MSMRGVGLERGEQLITVEPRHDEVGENQVVGTFADELERLAPVDRQLHRVTFVAQVARQ